MQRCRFLTRWLLLNSWDRAKICCRYANAILIDDCMIGDYLIRHSWSESRIYENENGIESDDYWNHRLWSESYKISSQSLICEKWTANSGSSSSRCRSSSLIHDCMIGDYAIRG